MPLPEKDPHTGIIYMLQDYRYIDIYKTSNISEWEIWKLWKPSSVRQNFYQDSDEQMKKKQLTNKKCRTEEKVVAQNFTAHCCAVAPLHFCVLLLTSNMLDSWKNHLDIFKKLINKKQFYLSCLSEDIIRRQDCVNWNGICIEKKIVEMTNQKHFCEMQAAWLPKWSY